MASTDLEGARAAIDRLMDAYRNVHDGGMSVLPAELTTGKVYEAWVLCDVLTHLVLEEGYRATLRRSTKATFKSSPGPINRKYPYFELTKPGRPELELWTDIEFEAMSYAMRGGTGPMTRGDRHELDVLVVPAGISGRPAHDQVRIGVECKNTGYTKDLLRSILGVRRELSLLVPGEPTEFSKWPHTIVPAKPPSCLLVYSSDPNVTEYAMPGDTYGLTSTTSRFRDQIALPLPAVEVGCQVGLIGIEPTQQPPHAESGGARRIAPHDRRTHPELRCSEGAAVDGRTTP